MRILLTAGPTREPIDAVRFIGNRSSGAMGAAIAEAGLRAGHQLTVITGPIGLVMPMGVTRIDVETSRQMLDVVMREFPGNDLLIMAAAVADYRPKMVRGDKMQRSGNITLELEATEDIVATAAATRRADQRVIGFSLEAGGGIERAMEKLRRKKLDLIVFNPTQTVGSPVIEPVLIWPDGHRESPGTLAKSAFAEILIQRATELIKT
jgi:phosphopantothenoylcysteine decarboxylase/phosphopantothenate--cysteine ligase